MCDESRDDTRCWSEVHDVWDDRPLLDRAFERLLCVVEQLSRPRLGRPRLRRTNDEAPATRG